MSTVLDRPTLHPDDLPPPTDRGGGDDEERRSWSLLAAVGGFGAFIALILAIILIAAAVGTGDKVSGDAAGASDEATVPAGEPVEVELGDMYIKPASITVAKGQHVTLHVTNKGVIHTSTNKMLTRYN